MRLKPNYFFIPLTVLVVALAGSLLTSSGMTWYRTINLPPWTPAGGFIGAVWTVIFILTAMSALVVWNQAKFRDKLFKWIVAFFAINGILNVLWSLLFFRLHLIGTAVWEAGALGLSVLILIILIWPKSKFAAWLLIPYFAWVCFATYLTNAVRMLN